MRVTETTETRRPGRGRQQREGSKERVRRPLRREARLLRWWRTRRGRIHLPRLSPEWLHWHETESDKRGNGW